VELHGRERGQGRAIGEPAVARRGVSDLGSGDDDFERDIGDGDEARGGVCRDVGTPHVRRAARGKLLLLEW
jgi:hypothetical protein